MTPRSRRHTSEDGLACYLVAILAGVGAVAMGSLIFPYLLFEALVALVAAERLGRGPGTVSSLLVVLGTGLVHQAELRAGGPAMEVNFLFLAIITAVGTWIGGAHHAATRAESRQAEQRAAFADVGRRALGAEDAMTLVRDTLTVTARVLRVQRAHFLEVQPDGKTLVLRAAAGGETGVIRPMGAAVRAQNDGPVTGSPLVLDTTDDRPNTPPAAWLQAEGARMGMRTVVRARGPTPLGVLGVYTQAADRVFTAHEVYFLEGMAFLLAVVLLRDEANRAQRTQAALQAALFAANDVLGDGVVVADAQRVLTANEAFARLAGRSVDELRRRSLDAVLPDYRVGEGPAAGPEGRIEPAQTRLLAASGPIGVEVAGAMFQAETRCVVVIVRDPRPRLALEREVLQARDTAEREARDLATVLAVLPVSVFIADAGGRIVTINQIGRRMWGETLPAPTGIPEYRRYRVWYRDTGEEVPAEKRPLAVALLEGRPVGRTEMVYERADGSRGYFASYAAPLRKDDGEVRGAVAVAVDETNEVGYRVELERLKDELEQRVRARTQELADANRELEAFSYTVAHDLRGPVRAIYGFTSAVLDDYGTNLPDEAKGFLRRVEAAARRMERLITDLLSLSKVSRHPVNRQMIDLSAAAQGVLDTLAERDPHRRVEVSIEPGLSISADPDLVQLLLENLLGNAWKFTRDRDPARIEIYRDDTDGGMIAIRDNGIGFDPVFSERIFQPFERLVNSNLFEGSGIGLSLVRRIVERHGGAIRAEGVPEKGAVFKFTLWGKPTAG